MLALALAGLGLAMGMTGPSADAKSNHRNTKRAPVVHTTRRTVTVHKGGGVVYAGAPASSNGSGARVHTHGGLDVDATRVDVGAQRERRARALVFG